MAYSVGTKVRIVSNADWSPGVEIYGTWYEGVIKKYDSGNKRYDLDATQHIRQASFPMFFGGIAEVNLKPN